MTVNIVIQYSENHGAWGYGARYLKAEADDMVEAMEKVNEITGWIQSRNYALGDVIMTIHGTWVYPEFRDAVEYKPEPGTTVETKVSPPGTVDYEFVYVYGPGKAENEYELPVATAQYLAEYGIWYVDVYSECPDCGAETRSGTLAFEGGKSSVRKVNPSGYETLHASTCKESK